MITNIQKMIREDQDKPRNINDREDGKLILVPWTESTQNLTRAAQGTKWMKDKQESLSYSQLAMIEHYGAVFINSGFDHGDATHRPCYVCKYAIKERHLYAKRMYFVIEDGGPELYREVSICSSCWARLWCYSKERL